MSGMTKRGSGQFGLSTKVGGEPNPAGTTGTKPGSGGGDGGSGLAKRGSGEITVDRSVKSPPTRRPAK